MAEPVNMTYAAFRLSEQMLIKATPKSKDGQLLLLPGEIDPGISYYLAAEKAKRFGRSINLKLKNVEANGGCLSVLTEANVLVSPSGVVTLTGEQILYNLSQDQMEAGLRRNYDSAADLVDFLFFVDDLPPDQQHLPPDVEHLTKMMRKRFDLREMFPVHGALVPASTYGPLYKELHDHVKETIPVNQYHSVLNILPHVDDWKNDVQKNLLLQWTYNNGNYTVPKGNYNIGYLVPSQEKALKALRIDPNGHPPHLSKAERLLIRRLRFFDFLRHRYAHRKEVPQDIAQAYAASQGVGQVPQAAAQAPQAQGVGPVPQAAAQAQAAPQVPQAQVAAPCGRGRAARGGPVPQAAPHGRGRAARGGPVPQAAPQLIPQAHFAALHGRGRGVAQAPGLHKLKLVVVVLLKLQALLKLVVVEVLKLLLNLFLRLILLLHMVVVVVLLKLQALHKLKLVVVVWLKLQALLVVVEVLKLQALHMLKEVLPK
jgi:hypothetical protein